MFPSPIIVIHKYIPFVECTSSFFVISAIGLPRCVLGIRKAIAIVVHLDRRASVTIRSGYTRFEHGNGSFRSRPAEGVNSPVSFAAWVLSIRAGILQSEALIKRNTVYNKAKG